jgi:IS4 transposase
MDEILDRFIASTPVAVMVHATLRRVFADSALNNLFQRHAKLQYTRDLTFSAITKLMLQVTTKKRPSLHAAYRHAEESLPVWVTSVYNKVNGLETGISQALVEETAVGLGAIIAALPKPSKPSVAGLRLRTLDGNFLAGTDHRLDCLRNYGAAALPGMSLVVRDGRTGLLTNMIPCEDAYTSERSLVDELLALAGANDLWLGDRNYCTHGYMAGLDEKKAYFVFRHHAGTKLEPLGNKRARGSNDSGKIFEQRVRISSGFTCRCITVELRKPLRDGSTQLRILTNVPAKQMSAKRALRLYLKRWEIETAFQALTDNLRCEINTLGYPKAALFGFALAMTAYNVLVVMRSALASVQASSVAEKEQAEEDLSSYHLALEATATTPGMLIAVPEESWERLVRMPLPKFAAWLVSTAAKAKFDRYHKNPRAAKKPTTVRRTQRGAHRSTARLLAEKRH